MSAEEVQIIPLAHHIQRPLEEQSTVESSTIWVSAAGSILMMKKVATEVQTSQAHMDASIQPRSHPLSVVLDPGAMNSTETGANPQGSHTHTPELPAS
ncbi:hypothetical protein JOQ06_030146 [Pogonophryne albipinna]|uniref:Uncharacterized protein n=1 Tax=Pogonophryne albipinna TaxID=1090488 RepID=A0AAD6FFK8_9TELE|nr:hypothetical protein JOQ06_030146 [Pogonophryne albipinna]